MPTKSRFESVVCLGLGLDRILRFVAGDGKTVRALRDCPAWAGFKVRIAPSGSRGTGKPRHLRAESAYVSSLPWVEWVGPRLLWLKGLKSCGECRPSGSFDFDAQKARVSAQDDALGRGGGSE